MFIISLTYKVPLEQVDKHLDAHIEFLNKQYELGNFQASGRKVPRTGGIILSTVPERSKLVKITEADPFHKHQLADYEITEFIPTKVCEEMKFLLKG